MENSKTEEISHEMKMADKENVTPLVNTDPVKD